MTEQQNLSSAFEALFEQKESTLLAQQGEVFDFVETNHKSKETENYLAAVRKAEHEINEILQLIKQTQKKSPEFRAAGEQLCGRFNGLKDYTRDMSRELSADLAKRQRTEDKKFDHVKMIAFVGGLGVAFGTIAKTFGESDQRRATFVGLLLGGAIAYREKIGATFKVIGRSVCEAPQQIKKKGAVVRNLFRKEARVQTQESQVPPLRSERIIQHLSNSREREP
jgi:hypothetical protein